MWGLGGQRRQEGSSPAAFRERGSAHTPTVAQGNTFWAPDLQNCEGTNLRGVKSPARELSQRLQEMNSTDEAAVTAGEAKVLGGSSLAPLPWGLDVPRMRQGTRQSACWRPARQGGEVPRAGVLGWSALTSPCQ